MKKGLFLAVLLPFFAATLANSANLLPNGSFEVGLGRWVGWEKMGDNFMKTITEYRPDAVVSGPARHGRMSLYLPNEGFVTSEFIKLSPEKTYTISLWAKSSGEDGRVVVNLRSGYRPGESGYGEWQSSKSAAGKIGAEWQRLEVAVKPPLSRNNYYRVSIRHDGSPVWVDGVQVEEGEKATDFRLASPLEASIKTGREKDYNLFYTGEPVPFLTNIFAGQPLTGKLKITYRLFDYHGKEAWKEERAVNAEGLDHITDLLKIVPPVKGIMRLETDIESARGASASDIVFSIVDPPRPPSKEDANSPVGIHVGGDKDIELAGRLGLRWVRLHDIPQGSTYWPDVEPEKGKFTWTDNGRTWMSSGGVVTFSGLNAYFKKDFQVLGCLTYIPRWAAQEKDGFRRLPKDIKDWGNYVFQTVSHYKGKISYWEVWNEPFTEGSWSDTPENYALLLKTAYLAAKKANPECKIVGGCIGDINYANMRSFVTRIFDAGALDYLDILSYHQSTLDYTSNPRPPENTSPTYTEIITGIREMMRKYGKEKPLWNSESGVWSRNYPSLLVEAVDTPDNRRFPAQEYDDAANTLVQMWTVESANNVRKSFFYWMGGPGAYEDEMQKSLLTGGGDTRLRPQAIAYSQFERMVWGARFKKEINWGSVARCYLFDAPGGEMAIAWGLNARKSPGALDLTGEARDCRFIDIMGNSRPDVAKQPDGTIRIPLGEEPVYIKGRKIEELLSRARISGLTPFSVASAIRKEKPDIFARLGYQKELPLAPGITGYLFLDGARNQPLIIVHNTRIGDTPRLTFNLKPKPAADTLSAGSLEVGGGPNRWAIDLEEPLVLLTVEGFKAEELFSALKNAAVSNLKEIELKGFWITAVQGTFSLTTVLENMGNRDLSGEIVISELSGGLKLAGPALKRYGPINIGKSETLDWPVEPANGKDAVTGTVKATLKTNQATQEVSQAVNLARCLRTKTPVKIDGDLSEWTDEGIISLDRKGQVVIGQSLWKGADNLSGRIRARYDDNFLYLAAEVRSDSVMRGKVGLYQGSAVEIFLDIDQRGDLGDKFKNQDDLQLLFVPATDDFPQETAETEPSYLLTVEGMRYKSRKTTDGYTMEIALPLKSRIFDYTPFPGAPMQKIGAGMAVGFDAALDTPLKDNTGRQSQIVWSGTANNWRDPSRYGTLFFEP